MARSLSFCWPVVEAESNALNELFGQACDDLRKSPRSVGSAAGPEMPRTLSPQCSRAKPPAVTPEQWAALDGVDLADELLVQNGGPREGCEQGDPLAPALCALGQHAALHAAQARLRSEDEEVFAFLDDLYVLTCVVAISVIQDSAKGHDRLCGISDIHSKRSWNCDRLATAIRRGNGRGGGQFTLVSNGRAIDGPQFLLPCGIDRCVRETLITCAAGRGAGIKKDVLGGGCCGNLFSDLNSLSRSIADGKQHFLDGALTFAALRVPRRHGRVSR
ncbi:unnamed protein product [Symbiodinium natans]|uniref:Reverse transcriptase domain-containing protein n=1 Tax=Symbiodinium natans TaxID=878477 RepID=A0A812Q4S9_9DINO|nr:unnamed protein product [Symbiodinium natans]